MFGVYFQVVLGGFNEASAKKIIIAVMGKCEQRLMKQPFYIHPVINML